MKLKTCPSNHEKIYTLKENCPICSKKSEDAHYKFLKIRDVKSDSK